jgi:hypothetical protein
MCTSQHLPCISTDLVQPMLGCWSLIEQHVLSTSLRQCSTACINLSGLQLLLDVLSNVIPTPKSVTLHQALPEAQAVTS